MSDLFQDEWQDQVPLEWGDWKFLRVENTRWEGNLYEFEHKACPEMSEWRITLHSSSSSEMDLDGRVYIHDRAPRNDYSNYKIDLDVRIDGNWKSIDEGLHKLDTAFKQLLAGFDVMRLIARDYKAPQLYEEIDESQ